VRGHPQGRGDEARFPRSAADLPDDRRAAFAAAFQEAAIDTLIIKIARAIDHLTDKGTPPKSLLIGGGVSANSLLRRRALELGEQRSVRVCLPAMDLCLDNAAMIAGLAFAYYQRNEFAPLNLPAITTASC